MIGSIVLATDQGLGYLAKDFFDHGLIDKVLIHHHTSRPNHYDWYPPEARMATVKELLDSCDALIFFEEVFFWHVVPEARERGIRTALMPMYECTRYPFPYEPDVVLCPSDLDRDFFPNRSVRINVPVEVKWKQRTTARTFVHNAGNGGLGGRNGTKEIIEAMEYVKSPIRLILRSQIPLEVPDDPRIELQIGQFPKEELFAEGDVFLFPEKFNGLSLPLQEAFASGMLVMAGNRYPINEWLPVDPLIPVSHFDSAKISTRSFKMAQYDIKEIAATIDAWYNQDITSYSLMGREWAQQNSWNKLKDKYEKLMLP